MHSAHSWTDPAGSVVEQDVARGANVLVSCFQAFAIVVTSNCLGVDMGRDEAEIAFTEHGVFGRDLQPGFLGGSFIDNCILYGRDMLAASCVCVVCVSAWCM